MQAFDDQVLDLAVLDRFYAARDFDPLVFRSRYLGHHLDMSMKRDRLRAINHNLVMVVEMQLRLRERMKFVLVDRLSDSFRDHVL